jgi:hypothetical protein
MNLSLSLSLGASRPSGGAPTPTSQKVALAANGASIAIYDWTNPGSMTAGDGGVCVQGAGDTIASVPNYKAPGTPVLQQSSATRRPIYDNGAVGDGTDDYLFAVFAGGAAGANVTLVYILKTTDVDFMIGGTNSASCFAGTAGSGSALSPHTGTGSPVYRVGGSNLSAPTRNGLFVAWATGSAVVAGITGADYSNVAVTRLQNAYMTTGNYVTGRAMLVAILDGGHVDYAAALALAEAEASYQIAALAL